MNELKNEAAAHLTPTKKIYDDEAYATTFTATVLSCVPRTNAEDGTKNSETLYDITLDQTLFFPEEGGQTCDRGSLRIEQSNLAQSDPSAKMICDILDVQIDKNGIITHTVRTAADKPDNAPAKNAEPRATGCTDLSPAIGCVDLPLAIGQTVRGKIDFSHRFSNMQNHTGEHIFSGLVHSHFGYENVGFHLSDNIVTMDYDGVLSDDDVKRIEQLSNEKIFANLPVRAFYPSFEELQTLAYRSKLEFSNDDAVRLVEIEGVDLCACCAPHVRSTTEVGILKVLDRMNYKGGTRLSILCGMRALSDYQAKHNAIVSISQTLSAKPGAVSEAVIRQKEELEQTAFSLQAVQAELLDAKIDAAIAANTPAASEPDKPAPQSLCLFVHGFPNPVLRNAVNRMVALLCDANDESGYAAIFDGDEESGYHYIIGSQTRDCREMQKQLSERFGAKGGGKEEMVQGSVTASEHELRTLFP